jgi:hypothetical protein
MALEEVKRTSGAGVSLVIFCLTGLGTAAQGFSGDPTRGEHLFIAGHPYAFSTDDVTVNHEPAAVTIGLATNAIVAGALDVQNSNVVLRVHTGSVETATGDVALKVTAAPSPPVSAAGAVFTFL